MTFEDFINQERPWLQNLNQIEQYKLVWNAAIASAINKIETKNNKYYELRIEEVDFNNKTILACAESAMTYLESELRKLLTA